MQHIVDIWLRRWRRGPADRTAFAGLRPLTVVTGGSAGIGRALALEFARAGQPLLLVARRPEALATAAREIEAATGVEVSTMAADVTAVAGRDAIDAALAERGAYCDILVNNAGMGLAGPFAEQNATQLAQLLELNMAAPTDLMRRHLPGMLARGRGGILNVASLGGFLPGPHQAAYYASKAYLIALSEAVADETRGQGVRICVLAPGPIDTGFHATMGGQSAPYVMAAGLMSPDYVARRAVRGYRWGCKLVVPGLHYRLLALVIRVMPHPILLPMTRWLLERRGSH